MYYTKGICIHHICLSGFTGPQMRSPSTQTMSSTGQWNHSSIIMLMHFKMKQRAFRFRVFFFFFSSKELQGHIKWDGKKQGDVQEEHNLQITLLQGWKWNPGFPMLPQTLQDKWIPFLRIILCFYIFIYSMMILLAMANVWSEQKRLQ